MKKILAVDNDLFMRTFFEEELFKKGHHVITAKSGLEAIDILESFIPDVIFIDLVMPNIDGFKLCSVIRKNPSLNKAFIVVLSAIAAEKKIDIMAINVDAVIAKGPLDKMAENITFVLDQPDIAKSICQKGDVLGLDNINYRGITHELLSVKRHFELIFQRMSEGILEISKGERIVYANQAAVTLIGIAEHLLLGKSLGDVISENDIDKINNLKKNKSKPSALPVDCLIELNNAIIDVGYLSFENEGEDIYFLIFRDVTQRKKAEQALKFLSSAVEQSSEGMAIADVKGNLMHVNQAWAEMHGYESPSKLIGKHLSIFHDSKQLKNDVEPFNALVMQNGSNKGDVGHIRKDGTPFPTLMTTTLLKDEYGNPIAISGIAKDITNIKKAEKNRYKLILELQNSLDKIRKLSGLLPICSHCKKIRDDKGYWNQIDAYIEEHSDAEFSHSICQECAKKYYPDMDLYDD